MSSARPISRFLLFVVLSASLATGCASTPARRIEQSQSIFDTYPAETQALIRAGRVDLGMDAEMVRMALGEPDEVSTEVSEEGGSLLWGYTKSRPNISLGLGGFGFGGRGVRVGGGVGVPIAGGRKYTALIEFRDGRVTSARFFDDSGSGRLVRAPRGLRSGKMRSRS